MIKLGLTGSIAMGKSEAARMLRRFGLPVFDADAAVHALLAPGGAAVAPVLAAFPDVGDDSGGIARPALARRVFGDDRALSELESILHPLVARSRAEFLSAAESSGARVAVLDIPLLFETGAEAALDRIAVVSAPEPVQRARALARPGMTPERLDAILARQTPDADKRRRADYILDSGQGKRKMLMDIKSMLRDLGEKAT